MQTHIIPCGFLNVSANEMIKPFSTERISKYYNIDSNGLLRLSMNALLVIQGDQVVLMDPGCAEFLPSRLRKEYGLTISEPIEKLLQKVGYEANQITDVIFTHLHFDHGSGAFCRIPGQIVKRFPNANYHVLKEHYNYALRPDSKERNSFFTSLFKFIDGICWLEDWDQDWLDFRIFNGHTSGMVVPVIRSENGDICYVTDLAPMEIFLENGSYSGYDMNPQLAIEEKQEFFGSLKDNTQIIFFHDPLKDRVFYL